MITSGSPAEPISTVTGKIQAPVFHGEPSWVTSARQEVVAMQRRQRANGRVPAQIDLVARREVAETQVGLVRREHEGRPIEPDGARNGLHGTRGEIAGVEDHARGICHSGTSGKGVEVDAQD